MKDEDIAYLRMCLEDRRDVLNKVMEKLPPSVRHGLVAELNCNSELSNQLLELKGI